MAVRCLVPNCRHNNSSDTCKFFKIPKDPKTRSKWLKLIRYPNEPKPYSAVCSCHFPEGKKINGPQNVSNNIKDRDYNNVQHSTLQDSQDLVTSTESHEIKDVSSYEDFEMVSKTETPAEIHENSLEIESTFPSFEIVYSTETPAEFHENEDDFNEQKIQMHLVTYTPAELSEMDHSYNQPSAPENIQMNFITDTSAKILKTEGSSCVSKSHKTLSKSLNNDSTTDSKPLPSFNSIAILEAENYFLKKELEAAKLLHRAAFSFDYISENKELVTLYTGLPNALVFNALHQLLENIPIKYNLGWKVEILTKKDQLFMTLMRIRHNFPNGDLAFRFNVSKGVVTNIITTWTHVLHEILLDLISHENNVPNKNKNNICFRKFTNCRFVSNCGDMSTKIAEESRSTQKQTLELLNVKVLGKLWIELHQVVWNGKKKNC